eukprot:IDg11486t1
MPSLCTGQPMALAAFTAVAPLANVASKSRRVCARRARPLRTLACSKLRAAAPDGRSPGEGSGDVSTEAAEFLETTLELESIALDPESGAVIVPPSYVLCGAFAVAAAAAWQLHAPGLAVPCGVLAAFLGVQTTFVRFVFGPTRFSVARRTPDGSFSLIRGWRYDQFAYWTVWWPRAAVLVYFRELESYAGRGSVHFFPVVCDPVVLAREFRRRLPVVEDKAE